MLTVLVGKNAALLISCVCKELIATSNSKLGLRGGGEVEGGGLQNRYI